MFISIEFCEICRKPIKKNEKNVKILLQEGKGFFSNSEAVAHIHVRCIDDGEHLGYNDEETLETLENIIDAESLRGANK